MKVLSHKENGLQHTLEIEVPLADIEAIIDAELIEVGKTVKIAGFRPGKVPMTMLRQKYGRNVLGDVLNRVVSENAAKALEEKKLKPATQPQFNVEKFEEGKDLFYSLTVEVLPEFKLTDLTKLSLTRPVAKADEKDAAERLKRLADQNKELELVTEDRKSAKGDVVVVDFRGATKEGVALPGMSGADMQIELGAGQMIPGFEDQLTGVKAGDHVHVEVTFPKDYGVAELAGKDSLFHVDVKAIYTSKDLPAAELAKKFGLTDEAALHAAIAQDIENEYNQVSRMRLKRELLDLFDEEYDFDLPPSMVKSEHDFVMKQVEQERKANGEGELTAENKDTLRALSERRVRLGLVLASIGQEQKVQVTQQELQGAVMNEAMRYPGQEREVFDYYQKNPQVLESLKAPIFEDKVIDYILSQAKVVEKTITSAELLADDEEDLLAPKKPKAKKAKAETSAAAKEAPAKAKAKK